MRGLHKSKNTGKHGSLEAMLRDYTHFSFLMEPFEIAGIMTFHSKTLQPKSPKYMEVFLHNNCHK